MATKCFHPQCNIGTDGDPGALYRINAKGVPGIWACRDHLKNTDAPQNRDPVTKVLDAAVRGEP